VAIALAIGIGGLSWLAAAPNEPKLQTSYWRQTRFIIPMNRPRGNPKEVQLLVSNDGQEWSVDSTITYDPSGRAPTEQFQFNAPRDGVYWFSARTIFPRQQARRGQPQPHLKVVVDTEQPQMNFDAFVGGAGEIVAQWRIEDDNLDQTSFLVEFQAAGDVEWRKVAVEPGELEGETKMSGQSSWFPRTSARTVHVRAEILDKAANRSVVSRRLVLPKIAQGERFQDLAAGDLLKPSPGAQQWTERDAGNNAPIQTAVERQSFDPHSQTGSDRSAAHPDSQVDSAANRWQLRQLGAPPAVRGDIQPRVAQRPADATADPAKRRQPIDYRTPSGVLPTMTRAMRFELDYDVESVAAHQLEKVELWRTTDRGATWNMWREDDDLTRPVMTVQVDREGVYGFRTVIVATTGLASRRPRTGDEADLWIGVDTTPPSTRIVSTAYGSGSKAGKLELQWEVADDALAPRPIALMFSQLPEGPWTTIVSGIPNRGEYLWNPGSRTPDRIYLRLEARDSAGNVGVHQTTDPIRLEGLSPRGRIRGFRPAP
jgi:hypothetical protein